MTTTILELCGFATLGFICGAGYHYLLHLSVVSLAGGGATSRLVAAQLLRLAAAGAVFWLIVQSGALPLLAAAAGFVASRFVAVRLVERRQ
jgi:hypothetical protein